MRITIEGTVQGVGFRPTVQKIATSLGLNGRVWNDGSMVIIDVDDALALKNALMKNLPPLAKVEHLKIEDSPAPDCTGFFITPSKNTSKSVSIPTDTAVCDKCLLEMRSKGRRKGYAFTTCTDCGARFTLLSSLPYDRDKTAMSDFLMCVDCKNEYQMIKNRRFHHQTICCPKCGPRYRLTDREGIEISGDPIPVFARMLDSGKIGIAKSWGGMHICCTLENVRHLREICHRPQKPFAIMVRDLEVAKKYVILTEKEKELLTSPNRPIVVANKNNKLLTEEIAPGLGNVGVFLPYTGMQHLLFDCLSHDALIMTSANIPGEPMIIRDEDVFDKLEADCYLLHDQKIINRADDSVVRAFGNKTLFIRKSRGFIPSYLKTNSDVCAIGIGAQENLSGTVSTNGRLYSTQYIGNGKSFNAIEYLETATDSLISLLGCIPQVVSMDMHPGYTNRKYGKRLSEKYHIPLLEIQHHWAHAISLLTETRETESAVLAVDGTGYGDDGNAWGGEVFIANLEGYERIAHLQYFPLIGGEKAVMDPVRLKFAIDEINGVDSGLVPERSADIYRKIMSNSIFTSSMGRFLDAMAVALGICNQRTYDGEPAMKIEPFLSKGKFIEGFNLKTKSGIIETVSMFKDIPINVSKADIAYTMTKSVIDEMANIACDNAMKKGIQTVGLTGGVSYNAPICKMAKDAIEARGLKFIMHDKVPCGDGGISVGQAVIAQQSIH
ncbi:MAG: carbamoyltransferase HypF [archaeon]|nr:carbamoyltransferase HypF [archaeon]